MSSSERRSPRPERNVRKTSRIVPSAKRQAYIDARVQGFTPEQAMKRAGYSTSSDSQRKALEAHPETRAALAKVQAAVDKKRVVTRERVFELIDEGFDMARSKVDAKAFFTGVQELNKMQGFYAAEKHEHSLSPELQALKGRVAELSEAELLEKLGGEQGLLLEAEYSVVEEEERD